MTAIRVELQLADGSFTSGMLRAGQSLAGFERQLVAANPRLRQFTQNGNSAIRSMQQLDENAKGFLATLRDLSIVTGLVSMGISAATRVANGWVGEIVRVNSEMERMRVQMQAMSTAADPIKDAADNVKYLREQATQMPFSLQAIQGAFTKLKATGIDPTRGAMNAIADGIAAFGGSDDQLQRVSVALAQMSGKSVIQMEELRQQLGEHMPSAMQVMARSMGISVADLTKQIATGTVSAKGNLERFYAELERSYGGSAQRMMQTFSGQIALLKTNLQKLATDQAGAAFFESVKQQLADINQALTGDLAKKIASDIGNALGTAVTAIRGAVETVWNFRNQLVDLAMIAGAGLGMMAAARGLQGLTAATLAATTGWHTMSMAVRSGVRDIALGTTGLTALSTATTGLGVAAIGARTVLGGLIAGLGAMAPALTIAAGAIYLIADGFGLLGSKTKDAYEELVKYGAESRKQAVEIIDARKRQLEASIAKESTINPFSKRDNDPKKLAEYRRQLEELEAGRADIEAASAERESQRELARVERRISDRSAVVQAEYRKNQEERQKAHEAEVSSAATTGASVKQIEARYHADNLKLQVAYYDTRRRIIGDEEAKLIELQATATGDQQVSLAKQLNRLADLKQQILQEQASVERQNGNFGVDRLNAPESDEAKIKRGTQTLSNLRSEVAGLEADFNGGNDALGKLKFQLSRGDFGAITDANDAVKKLHTDLLAATAAKEALDKIMRGRNRLDADVERNRLRILEKEMELEERRQGRELTEAEKIKLRLANGYYDGLGSAEKIKKDLDGLTGSITSQGTALEIVGNAAKQQAFGEQTVQRIKLVTEEIQKLATSITTVGTNLNGLNFANLGAGLAGGAQGLGGALGGAFEPVMQNLPKAMAERMNMAMDILMKKGWSKQAAAGIAGNLSVESAMNPLARNKGDGRDGSDSIGLGQWNSNRALNLQRFAAQKGKSWQDFQTQIEFIDWELRNTESKAGNRLQMARDARQASDIFMRDYERPAQKSIIESGGKRAGNAVQAYNNSAGVSNPTSPVLPSSSPQLLPLPPLNEVRERVSLQEEQARKTGETNAKLDEQAAQEKRLTAESKVQDRIDAENKLKAALDATADAKKRAGKSTPTEGATYEKTIEDIRLKKYGENADPRSAEYKNLLDLARQLDGVENNIAETKRLTNASEREIKKFEEERLELNRRIAEQQKKAADPNYKPDSQALQQLRTDLDAHLKRQQEIYGVGTVQYQQALQLRSTMLQGQTQLDLTTQQAAIAKETQDRRDSLLTQSQLRSQTMQRDMAAVDAWVEKARAAGMNEVEITRQAEEAKASIRAQYAQQSDPMARQMKEWSDLQGNLAKQSTQWMDSIADGITGVIMGTTDIKTALKQIASQILKDFINSGIKKMMSGMMGDKTGAGAGGGKKGAAGGVASAAARGGKKAVGVAHTGGIIGSSALSTRRASPLSFIGAPKFHTGGIVGGGMLPSEVPIIAKKGEGVFTPEQMEQMGGFSQTNFQVHAPVTVNGSSGTPEQNQDLAQKVSRELSLTMRSVVADEVRKQTRPGNFMNTRSR